MQWSDIPGWFDYQKLFDAAVERAKDGDVFVEVGCWLGRSTAYLAQRIKESGKVIRLFAVEHGFGSPGGEDYHLHQPVLEQYGGNIAGKLISNLEECDVLDHVIPLIMDSVPAAWLFHLWLPNADFVFIDGAHDPASVERDLGMWWANVSQGGVMAGHDYDGCWLGVVDTVNKFFGVPGPVHDRFPLKDKDTPNCWSRVKSSDTDTLALRSTASGR